MTVQIDKFAEPMRGKLRDLGRDAAAKTQLSREELANITGGAYLTGATSSSSTDEICTEPCGGDHDTSPSPNRDVLMIITVNGIRPA